MVSGLIDDDVVENDLLHLDINFFAVSNATDLWVSDKLKLIDSKSGSNVGNNADNDVAHNRDQEEEVRKRKLRIRH